MNMCMGNIFKKICSEKCFMLLASIMVCLGVGSLGSIFTSSSVSSWYPTLIKPSFNPPGWIFGPVWTILYILMGIALYLIWTNNITKKRKKVDEKIINMAIIWFFIQLGLNFLWSIMFFGLHSPLLGLINIILLDIAVIITKYKFYQINKTSCYLLLPYLLWITFATVLNFALWYLN
jgi:translocator protein